MLSECRRRGTQTAGRVREFDGDAGLPDAAGGGMIHLRHHLPVTHLGMREDLGKREDRPVGHTSAVQDFYPGRCRSGLEDAFEVAHEHLAVSCPGPVRSRTGNAARIPKAAYMPAQMSAMATPTFTGEPPSSPVIPINPPIPCRIRSYAVRSRNGPSCPKPEMDT